MDDRFSLLERRVEEAVALIQKLRRENQELHERCGALDGRCVALQDEREHLRRQLDEARELADAAADFQQRRQLIEDKVAGLLDKLEGIA